MLTRRNCIRSIFYSKENLRKNWYYNPHSDLRNTYIYKQLWDLNADAKYAFLLTSRQLRERIGAWTFLLGVALLTIYKSSKLQRKFEINYLNSLPAKEFDAEDYDYKFWEVILTSETPSYGNLINTESATKEKYLLLYHAALTDPHIPMQRFSRLKRYILQRKNLNIESLFVCMDSNDPEEISEYARRYSKDMLSALTGSDEVKAGLQEVFLNLGNVYLLEKNTGIVIGIFDPKIYSLEVLAQKILLSISKHEDLKTSREFVVKSVDIRQGAQDILEHKPPIY
jgi:hypothetical protein